MRFFTLLFTFHFFLFLYTLFSYVPLLWTSDFTILKFIFFPIFLLFIFSFPISIILIKKKHNTSITSKSIMFRSYGALLTFFLEFVSILVIVDVIFFIIFTLSFGIPHLSLILSYIPLVKIFIVPVIAFILILWGYINHFIVRVVHHNLKIEKNGDYSNLKIAALSDLHLGQIHTYSTLFGWVKKINKLRPDVVLLLGDIINLSLDSLDERTMGLFKRIKAPLGVFAILGNHDLLKETEEDVIKYFNGTGIRFLIDESIVVNNNITLIGRNDKMSHHKRLPLKELLAKANLNNLSILMDHRPLKSYKKVVKENRSLDVILSGHTHGGQFFPFTIINHFSYTLNKGYKKVGKSHAFVSEGIGVNNFFPFRIGTKPEILFFTFK